MTSVLCAASVMSNDESRGASAELRGCISLQNAFVLHRRAYRESSFLLDVLTLNFGRVHLLAKGARKDKKGLHALLQPFVRLRLSWVEKGELPILTAAESVGTGVELSGVKLFCGFYVNELLLNFLPSRDPHPEVFHLYRYTLTQLATDDAIERILRLFEVSLLDEVGYGMILDREAASGQPIDPAKRYVYSLDQGPIENDERGADTVGGDTLLALEHRTLSDPNQLLEAKQLMRRVIHYYLDGKPLKSRDFFKQVTRDRRS